MRAIAVYAIVAITAVLVVMPTQGRADPLSLDIGTYFSPNPDGLLPGGPWLNATFANNGANKVTLTLTANAALPTSPTLAFVFDWYFNSDVLLSSTDFAFQAGSKVGSYITPAVATGSNLFKADGDGDFDIKITFDNTDGATNRFTAGDVAVFEITKTGLTSDNFNFSSSPNGAEGTFLTAAHIGGTGDAGIYDGQGNPAPSVWATNEVPEPATYVTLLAILGTCLCARRFRMIRAARRQVA